MGHDIIDNRTRELAPEINAFLADSIRAHFAVGYFFLSGLEAVADQRRQPVLRLPVLGPSASLGINSAEESKRGAEAECGTASGGNQ